MGLLSVLIGVAVFALIFFILYILNRDLERLVRIFLLILVCLMVFSVTTISFATYRYLSRERIEYITVYKELNCPIWADFQTTSRDLSEPVAEEQ
jgi:hypothetical protein